MVFVRRVPGRSGGTKVQLAKRRAGREVVVDDVGTAHSEAERAVLMAEARRRLRPGQGVVDLDVDGAPEPGRSGVIRGRLLALLWRVLEGVDDRLGFDAIGDEAFKQLVLARIIEPTSQADSLRVLDEVGIGHAWLRTMFRSLARARERGYRHWLAAACDAHASTRGDLSLCLYEVTMLCFEAEAEDEDDLRMVGYSKERRVDPQVVVGLLVDRGGFPMAVGCLQATGPDRDPAADRSGAPAGVPNAISVEPVHLLRVTEPRRGRVAKQGPQEVTSSSPGDDDAGHVEDRGACNRRPTFVQTDAATRIQRRLTVAGHH